MLKLAAGAICGLGAGMVTGVGARAAMRMVADGVPDPIRTLSSFTPGGTVAIIVFAGLAGAPFGVLFAVVRDALPRPRRARGLLFGVAMLVTVGPLFFTGARDEFITYERMVLFGFLFLLFGLAAGFVFEPSQRLARRLPDPARWVLAFIAIAFAVPWLALGLAGAARFRRRGSLAAA
jgi:hypothetical protein